MTATDEAASTKIAEFGLCLPEDCESSDVVPIVRRDRTGAKRSKRFEDNFARERE